MSIAKEILEISCKICKKPIKQGERHRGIGKARKTKNANTILCLTEVKCWCHTKCLKKLINNGQKENPKETIEKVMTALSSVGENPSKEEVSKFIKEISKKKEDIVSEVVREWISAKTV